MSKCLQNAQRLCHGCVYYPPNLPAQAYPEEDWKMLQEKACSYDFVPGDTDCDQVRKTACSIIDLSV